MKQRIDCKHRRPTTKKRKIIWQRLVDKYGEKCQNCGSVENLTIDHIRALSLGGTNRFENFQILCDRCNGKKSGREFREANKRKGIIINVIGKRKMYRPSVLAMKSHISNF
jgi:5-methylcytosine-specific restriction endonuclease McrA